MPETPSASPDEIVQELARYMALPATRVHVSDTRQPLCDLLARRCGTRPRTWHLWRRFRAEPHRYMTDTSTWLARELRASPGFARQVQSLWQHFRIMTNRALPASPAATRAPAAAREPESLLMQSLPTNIQQLWQMCVPERMTRSLLASVEHMHKGTPLADRVQALVQHMIHYLRLSALQEAASETAVMPLYSDSRLLRMLESYLHLPASASSTRNTPSSAAPAAPAAAHPAAPTVTRHAEMECPDRVWIGTPLIQVVARLKRPPAERQDDALLLHLREDLPIQVWVTSPGFDVLGPHVHTIRLETGQDEVEFDLQPQLPGRTYVAVNFLQAGTPLGSMTSEVEIAEHVSTMEQNLHIEANRFTMDVEAESPDLTLFVHYDTMHAAPRLLLNLYCDGELSQTYPPLPLHADPSTYYEEIYSRLSDLTDLFDMKKGDSQALAAMQRAVRNLGHGLWNDLIPQGLQERYALERTEWEGKTFLVITDEPYIPWELMWPYGYQEDVWDDEAPWCMTMRMTRWLRRNDDGMGLQGPPTQLQLENFAFIGPADTSLAAVGTESAQLRAMMQQAGIRDASPPHNTLEQVQNLLEAGTYDWFHLASHGEFSAALPDRTSAILLEGRQALTPDTMIGPRIQSHLYHRRPGFVLNACHTGRQGWALTRLGGWANRLVGSGAGIFLGPLWTVTDDAARQFAAHFYTHLLAGNTVADALYEARCAIRATGDPTWLAYSAYAHPNARVRRAAGTQ